MFQLWSCFLASHWTVSFEWYRCWIQIWLVKFPCKKDGSVNFAETCAFILRVLKRYIIVKYRSCRCVTQKIRNNIFSIYTHSVNKIKWNNCYSFDEHLKQTKSFLLKHSLWKTEKQAWHLVTWSSNGNISGRALQRRQTWPFPRQLYDEKWKNVDTPAKYLKRTKHSFKMCEEYFRWISSSFVGKLPSCTSIRSWKCDV